MTAVVRNVAESRQPQVVMPLLNRYRPDILVVTRAWGMNIYKTKKRDGDVVRMAMQYDCLIVDDEEALSREYLRVF